MILQPGPIRLATLDAGGTKTKTLWLPAPAKGSPSLEWERKATTWSLVDGSERQRLLGFLPILTVRWQIYDDTAGNGYTIGTADGNRPSLDQLLVLLSAGSNALKVSPGRSAGGLVVGALSVKPVVLAGAGFAQGLEVVFRGRDIRSDMTLGTF